MTPASSLRGYEFFRLLVLSFWRYYPQLIDQDLRVAKRYEVLALRQQLASDQLPHLLLVPLLLV